MGKGYYREGRHLVVCDITGQQCWDDEVRRQWDGTVVRKESWSPRHPQELIRVRPERGPVRPLRPVPPDVFTATVFDLVILESSPSDEFWALIWEDGSLMGWG